MSGPQPRKLDASEMMAVLAMLADPFYSTRRIVDEVFNRFGKSIDYTTISKYAHVPRYKTIIDAIRETIINDLSSIPVANKSVRLKYLQEAIELILTDAKVDLKVDKDGGEHFLIAKLPGLLAPLIKEARLEMQGHPSFIGEVHGDVIMPGAEKKVSFVTVLKEISEAAKTAGVPSVIRETLAGALKAEART